MKHVVIVSVEILLLFVIVFSFILAAPSIAKSQSNTQPLTLTNFADIYRKALLSPFTKASGELKDEKMSNFFDKFVASMELDKVSIVSDDNPASLANLLPDLVKIQKNALSKPLLEAGEQIKDKELAQFYYNFLEKCGVTR